MRPYMMVVLQLIFFHRAWYKTTKLTIDDTTLLGSETKIKKKMKWKMRKN